MKFAWLNRFLATKPPAQPPRFPEQNLDALTANDAGQLSADDLVKQAFANNAEVCFQLLSTRQLPESIAKLSQENPKRKASVEILRLLTTGRLTDKSAFNAIKGGLTNTDIFQAIKDPDILLIGFYQQLEKTWSSVHAIFDQSGEPYPEEVKHLDEVLKDWLFYLVERNGKLFSIWNSQVRDRKILPFILFCSKTLIENHDALKNIVLPKSIMALPEDFQIFYRLLKAISQISSQEKMQNLADLAAYIIKCIPERYANSTGPLLLAFGPDLTEAPYLGPVFLSNPGRFDPPSTCHVTLLAVLHDPRVYLSIPHDALIPIVQNLYRLANPSLKGLVFLVSSFNARRLLQEAYPVMEGFDEPATFVGNLIKDLEIDPKVETSEHDLIAILKGRETLPEACFASVNES